ncbi:EF-hand domain-containing protein [Aporhodopirellula aestuarii]|uniref:EF-hand domain-containing protein n=1 Tax=Aporhodopirellula aestuarii TaxID=2950107 RepID=A0ABT0TWJ0_9BACT|nr:hypothetical protein [Aporhodopirellula aestuarii]MCM2369004.1 hypothetical protein [Aporhodopirellula aestuarii]
MKTFSMLLCGLAVFTMTGYAYAQPPGGRGGGRGGEGGPPIDRLMALDVNGDGQISADEVTDPRMKQVLDRADKDQNGVVTKAELAAMAAQFADGGGRGRGAARDGGQGGQGGPGGRGEREGFGGRGGAQGGPPPVGQIIPPFAADELSLTSEQRAAIATLQAQVDAELAKILTTAQLQKLKEGPGGQRGGGDQGFGERRQGRPSSDR